MKGEFQDTRVRTKHKLSILWISVMFCYIYGDYFALYPPGQVEEFIQGKTRLDSPMKLLAAAVLMTIPSLMVLLSLTLRPSINRVLNLVFGTVFTAIMLLIAVSSIASWWAFYVYFAVIETLLTSLIVWTAWKWPRTP